VQEYLEGTLKLPPSQDYLKQEIENIITVCNSEIRAQIEGVRAHQMTVAWENYIHDTFREKKALASQY